MPVAISITRPPSTVPRRSLALALTAPYPTNEVRQSIPDEEDGAMLLHGLKDMHDRPIYLPREVTLQPDRGRLEERYAAFVRNPG